MYREIEGPREGRKREREREREREKLYRILPVYTSYYIYPEHLV